MEPVVDAVLDGGSTTNEDRYGVVDGAAWVLDGTSGFGDRRITSHPESDGVWFVESAHQYLQTHVHDDATLSEVVADTIEHVMRALIEEVEATVSPSATVADAVSIDEIPAATIALVRWDESTETLQYYSLGDAAAVLRTTDGTVNYHDEGGPTAFEDALHERVSDYVATNPDADYDEIRAELRPHIRRSRKYREVPGGFWCLGVNPVSAYQGLTGEYNLNDVADVTLFSDGFTQVCDLFGMYEDWAEAVADIRNRGVEPVVADLRATQRREGIHSQPRLKPMDDTAVVHLRYPD